MSSSFIEKNQQAVEALTRYYIQNTFQRSARIDHTVEHALQETLESMYIPHEDSDIKIESCQKIIEFSEYIAGKVVLYMADKENPQREHDKNQILREIGWSYYGRFDFPRKERNKKTNKMEEVFREYLYVYIDPVGFNQGWEFLQVCAGPNPLLKTKDGTPITDPNKIDKFACNFTMVNDIEEAVQFALDEEPRPGFFFKQTPAQISSAIAFVSDIKRLPAYIVSKVIPFYQKIIDTELEARNVARQREAVEKRYEDAVIYGAAEVVEPNTPEETPEVSHYGMTDGDEDSFEFLDGGDDDHEAEDDTVEDADNDETPSSPIQPAVDSQASGAVAVDDTPAGTSGRHEAPRRGFFQRLRDSIQRPVNDTVAPVSVVSPLGAVSEEQKESPADANSGTPAVEATKTETVGDTDVTLVGRHRKDDAEDDTDADANTEDTESEDTDKPDSEESFEPISETFNWGSVSAQYPADNHAPLGVHDTDDSADEADSLDASGEVVAEVDDDVEEIVDEPSDSEEDDAGSNDASNDVDDDNDSDEAEQKPEEDEPENGEDSAPAPAVEAKFTDDSTAIISLKQIGVSENDRILLDPKKHIDGDDDWMKGSK